MIISVPGAYDIAITCIALHEKRKLLCFNLLCTFSREVGPEKLGHWIMYLPVCQSWIYYRWCLFLWNHLRNYLYLMEPFYEMAKITCRWLLMIVLRRLLNFNDYKSLLLEVILFEFCKTCNETNVILGIAYGNLWLIYVNFPKIKNFKGFFWDNLPEGFTKLATWCE